MKKETLEKLIKIRLEGKAKVIAVGNKEDQKTINQVYNLYDIAIIGKNVVITLIVDNVLKEFSPDQVNLK